jgi:hypothetical protein
MREHIQAPHSDKHRWQRKRTDRQLPRIRSLRGQAAVHQAVPRHVFLPEPDFPQGSMTPDHHLIGITYATWGGTRLHDYFNDVHRDERRD